MKIVVGSKAGRWLVLAPAEPLYRRRFRAWLCRCTCGLERIVVEGNLVRGLSASCGCGSLGNYRHGQARVGAVTPEYRIWTHMVWRCHNPKDHSYQNYGGRGIMVCAAWSGSFEMFLRDVGPRPGPGYSIDRIDNNRGYEPGNVRWATKRDQSRNMRCNRRFTADGRTQVLEDWAAELGVHPAAILGRLRRGWSVERAVLEPKRLPG